MPRPPIRNSEFSDELMHTYDRALELRAEIAKLRDELRPIEKRLTWDLMPEAFGEHWGPPCPSPANNERIDSARPHPVGGGNKLDRDWEILQHDVEALRAAYAAWKCPAPT
jgi:hypothetical protein